MITVHYIVLTPRGDNAKPYDAAKFFSHDDAAAHLAKLQGYKDAVIEARQEAEAAQHPAHGFSAAVKDAPANVRPGLVRAQE